ncbi:ABC transporter permease [Nocardioides sp. BP30]|uniref:ABC transporter permease n=1 Tax=Nocardioides sp. BP30 TaxID=3036374 RepID=UPI0024683A29|nr:ABC transporter permease [Nocardioides sp. BP30]WGL52161.1 ABC transporter permease [Nocardioides sp. BP30]
MSFLWQGLQQAWHLIVSHDPYLWGLVNVTLKVCAISTGIGLAVGLPIGLTLGLGRFPGRGVLVTLANAGLGLPPVIVGVVLAVLMFPTAPLAHYHLLFTLRGVYLAQTILAIPIIIALTTSAVSDIAPGLIAQARAFGARRHRIALLALREARVGIFAAIIAAIGSGLSEVGAVAIVGGNAEYSTQTLASAALEKVGAGRYAEAIAIGILLMGLILIVTTILTVLQYAGAQRRVGRSS